MAYAREYNCGCIVHDLAGVIRFCPGTISKSLSGREVRRDESAQKKHDESMKKSEKASYEVADILP
jgi:hypothetical protein